MKKFILAALLGAPLLSMAAPLDNISSLMKQIGKLVDLALPIVVGIALLGFFYGLAKFVFAAGDEEARKNARSIMIYGVVALFVMVSVWGLVGFLGQTVGIAPGATSGVIPSVSGL